MVKKSEQKQHRQIGAKFDVEQWRRLRALAIQQGRTGTELLHEAISDYLQRHEKGVRK